MKSTYEVYDMLKNKVVDILNQPSCSQLESDKIKAIGSANIKLNEEIVDKIGHNASSDDCLKLLVRVQRDFDSKIHEIKEVLTLIYTNQVNNDVEIKGAILASFSTILDEAMRQANKSTTESPESTLATTDGQPSPAPSPTSLEGILDRVERIITNPTTWKILIPIAVVALGALTLAHFNPDAFQVVGDLIKDLAK